MRNGGVAAADSAATHTRQINIKAVVKQGNFAGDGGSKQMEPEAFVEETGNYRLYWALRASWYRSGV